MDIYRKTSSFLKNVFRDHHKKLALVILFNSAMGILFMSPGLSARDNAINFLNISIKEGLSQGSILAILQDRKGFLWFGTEVGLNKYDGYKFTIYKPSSDDPNSLSDNTVWSIFEDSRGVLWVGTLGGLNRYDRDKDNFTRYQNNPSDPQSLSNNAVYAIYEDRARRQLWVGTEGGGLNALDRKTGKFMRFVHESRKPQKPGHDAIYAIYEDKSELLWLATYGGLHALDPKTGRLTRYVHDPRDPLSLSHDHLRTIYEDRAGTLWVGTEGGGLNAFDRKTGKFTRYLHDDSNPDSLSNNNVYTIFQDRSDSLWIGTNEGLNKFDFEKKNFTVIRNDPANIKSLSYDYVTSIYEDRTGVLWIGTRGKGVNKYVPDKRKFNLYESIPHNPNSLVSNYVRAIAEDGSGNLWIGTENRGLDYFERKNDRFTHYRHEPGNRNSPSSNFVYALQIDGIGAVWIGTLGGGLDKYDPKTRAFAHFLNDPEDPGSLSHNSIRSLRTDHLGALWVGTEGGGLNKFISEKNKFIRYRHDPSDPESLSHDIVRLLFEDRSGILWVGTFGGGLNRFDRDRGKFNRFRHDPANPNSLCNDFIMSMNEDSAGDLWIGTLGGINKFDRKTGTFICFTEKDGLSNNAIYGILVDEADNIWISSNRGLSKLNPRTGKIKNYDDSDGLQSNEFNGGSYYKTRGGEMFFGGTNGLNSFFPESIQDNPFIPTVVITDFQIFNKTVPIGKKLNGKVVLERSISETFDLALSYQDRLISFEFAALHYAAPEKNGYAYIMEGLEKEWNYVKDRRFVSYTNLRPGQYTFRVKASNNDGVWNENGVALRIRIVPPGWQTRWFQGLAAILVLLLVGAVYRLRTRNIRQRNLQLERKIQARTAELHQEIAVRGKTEKELERRQKYLEAVLFSSPNAIVTIDAQSRIIEWSPGAENIFGWKRDEVLGKDIDDVVIRPDLKEEAAKLSKVTHSGEVVNLREAVRHRKDGTPLNVILGGSPIYIGDELAGGMVVYTDTSELVAARKQAQEANRAKSEFLANMSHEIRTPMNGIFGMTELALQTKLTTVQREYLEAVKASAESLMNIINDILDFSKIEAKKVDIEKINFNLRDTIHAMVSSLTVQADKKGLELAYHIPTDIPDRVVGDPGRLRQVLTNLLSNAIKFTNQGEVVTLVSIEQRIDKHLWLHFQVRDTGIGIPPDKLKVVFDPFMQADSSTTRLYGGTGLGLTISSQLIELMGGRLWAESELGKGSTFHFNVPLGLQEGEEAESKPVKFEDIQGVPVLVVDDNATNRRILEEMLAHWHMRPTAVESGARALEALEAARLSGQPFRLILIDANMPYMDGFELAAQIKKHPEFRKATIMMLSSAGFRGDASLCRKLGLAAYLTKPIKQSSLLDAIMLALGTSPEKKGETSLITRHSLEKEKRQFSILLAEDNIINQKMAMKILENQGHLVTIANDGLEALAALEKDSFDLILMDVQMPNLDGFQATEMIRKKEQETAGHVPIVAMTAHALKGDRERCLAAGMDDYISKPLRLSDLIKTIENILSQSKKARPEPVKTHN
jgi:PAS domain S-box-containing protein